MICKYLLPLSRLPFRFERQSLNDGGSLQRVEAFQFDAVIFAYFCFYFPCLGHQSHKNTMKTRVSQAKIYVFLSLWFQMLHSRFIPF